MGVYLQFEATAYQQGAHIWCLLWNLKLIVNMEALYGLKVAMNITGMFCNVLFPHIHYVTPAFSFVKKAKQFWQVTAFFCFPYSQFPQWKPSSHNQSFSVIFIKNQKPKKKTSRRARKISPMCLITKLFSVALSISSKALFSALLFCTLTDKGQEAQSDIKDISSRPAVYKDEQRQNSEGQRQRMAF